MDESLRFTSGDWAVTPGNETEFVSRWTSFVQWSKDNATGAGSFFLLRDEKRPEHFVSFGSWRDPEAVTAWRGSGKFAELLGECRSLCDSFEGRDYSVAASVGGTLDPTGSGT